MTSTDSGGMAVEVESSARASFNWPVYNFRISSTQRAANLEGNTKNLVKQGVLVVERTKAQSVHEIRGSNLGSDKIFQIQLLICYFAKLRKVMLHHF